eukprot:1160561-Pelagomonas_calceolata.AAC.8
MMRLHACMAEQLEIQQPKVQELLDPSPSKMGFPVTRALVRHIVRLIITPEFILEWVRWGFCVPGIDWLSSCKEENEIRKMVDYTSTGVCSHTTAALFQQLFDYLSCPHWGCPNKPEGLVGKIDEAEQVLADSILLPAERLVGGMTAPGA